MTDISLQQAGWNEVKKPMRISMPSNSPWFVGYTENPLGVKPNGIILNERRI